MAVRILLFIYLYTLQIGYSQQTHVASSKKKSLSGIINTQDFNPLLANMLQDTLDYYVSQISNIKGMSASVFIPNQGLWSGVSGSSHSGLSITSDMQFGIASNSKLFTSVIILKFAENNVLELDDSIQSYLTLSNANINPNITIRQLLNHSSGISDPLFISPWVDTINNNPTRTFTSNEVLGWVGPPFFQAGTSYGYSNINYILAGMIAESVSGINISQLIRDSILTPLNLDSIFYDIAENTIGILAHRWWNSIDYNDTSRVGLNTAGGCAGSNFSRASDMALWYNYLFNGQIISQSSINQLSTFINTNNPNYQYGLGLSKETTQGYTNWGHGGSTWGYKSKMIYDSCLNVSVSGLSNSFPSGMDAVTFLLYRVVKNHIPACSGPINGPSVICAGEDSIIFSISPINNATSYVWTLPAGMMGVSNTNTIIVNVGATAISGDIIVTGLNTYGTGGSSSLWINVNPVISSACNGTAANCNNADGTAQVTASGGLPPYVYTWSNGASTSAVNNLTAGVYTVVVTDINACTAVCSYTVSSPPGFTLTGTATDLTCYKSFDGSMFIQINGGVSPYTYLWSDGRTNKNRPSVKASIYTITITDANGCTATTSLTVNQPAKLLGTKIKTPVSCNGGNDGACTIVISGGTAPYTYLWNTVPVQSTATATGLSKGVYQCITTDAHGCTRKNTVFIPQPAALWISMSKIDVSSHGGNDGTCTASPAGGTSPYAYVWNTGATTATISGLVAGTYTCTVTDMYGCTVSKNKNVNEPPAAADEQRPDQEQSEVLRATVYPNPNHGIFVLELHNPQEYWIQKIEILTLDGRRIQQRIIQTNKARLEENFDIQPIPSGIYVLKIYSRNQVLTKRFAKMQYKNN